MSNFIDRMYNEIGDLSDKIMKLKKFREGEVFDSLPREDRDLLIAQENAMVTYHEILNIRYRKLKGEYK